MKSCASRSLSGMAHASAHGITRIGPTRADDRTVQGRALRDDVPRESHGRWIPQAGRPHPVDLLGSPLTNPDDTAVAWYDEMLASPLDFFERAAAIMAYDLATTPVTGIPVQLCGDCHPANFGQCRSADGTLRFALRDFDETLPGPWEWDVKRLATGLLLTGRNNRLGAARSRDLARSAVQSYRQHMIEYAAMRALDVWNAQVTIGDVELRSAHNGGKRARKVRARRHGQDLWALCTQVDFVDGARGIAESRPTVARLDSKEMEDGVCRAFRVYREFLPDMQRFLLEQYRLVDVVRVTAGLGSQPTESFIWLLEGKDMVDTVFLQVKEARRSVLEPYLGSSSYPNSGHRMVAGQQWIQGSTDPFLGFFRTEEGRDYYARDARALQGELVVETMDDTQLIHHAEACGWALARGHARSGDRIQIAAYLGEGEKFDRAVGDFADLYADQVERDHRALVDSGRRPGARQPTRDGTKAGRRPTEAAGA